jgi:hypothetical protein
MLHPWLADDPRWLARLREEVAAARRVSAWCTARVLDAEFDTDPPYIVSEYVEGPTLREQIAACGPMAEADTHSLAIGVAAALVAVHSVGVVHRDLKPSNVILSRTGPRVIDFGIALHPSRESTLTQTGVVIGSPGWMAPEQVIGDRVTTAADVFTWGTLVSFAARGRSPFGDGDPVSLSYRVVHEEPDLTAVPTSLREAVRSAMSRDPVRRPDAEALLRSLLAAESATTVPLPIGEVIQQAAARVATHVPATVPLPLAGPAERPEPVSETVAVSVTPVPVVRRASRLRLLLLIGMVLVPALALGLVGYRVWDSRENGSGRPYDTLPSSGFVVGSSAVECGLGTLVPSDPLLPGEAATPDGEFCRVTLTLTNPTDGSMDLDSVYWTGLDAEDFTYSVEYEAYLDATGEVIESPYIIGPGASADVELLFDVPTGVEIDQLEMQDLGVFSSEPVVILLS